MDRHFCSGARRRAAARILLSSLVAWTLVRAAFPADPPRSLACIPDDTPLDAVKWTGGFWKERMERLRNVYLPGVLEGSFMSLENGSTFLNLLRAAKLEKGGAQGSSWSDGDCYLVLDTVARLQSHHPDAYLQAQIDRWISILSRMQREDGQVDSWAALGEFDGTHGKPWRWQIKRGQEFHGALHYNTGSLYAFAATLQRASGDGRGLAIADRAVRQFMEGNRAVAGPMQWAVPHLYGRKGDPGLLDALRRASGQNSVLGPPVRMAEEIFGHNTQAAHTLLRETALCGLTGDGELLSALTRLAGDQLTKKTFVTGAIAPVHRGRRPELRVGGKSYAGADYNEAVGPAYELPNDSAYCESCGQCLFAEWYYRMFRLTGEAVYLDAVERALYNTVPGCVDLDRPNFFYCNPQEQLPGSRRSESNGPESKWEDHYTWRRQFTKKAACCPPKVMRALAMSAEMAVSVNREGLWVNLYGEGEARVSFPAGGTIGLRQSSAYPWDGEIKLVLQEVKGAGPFSLFLRIPGWVDDAQVAINGESCPNKPLSGSCYRIERKWRSGDAVELRLPMPVRLLAAHPNVKDARGKVAVMRGPIVYCLEGDDIPADTALERLRFPAEAELQPVASQELGGVVKLSGRLAGRGNPGPPSGRLIVDELDPTLYRTARFAAREGKTAESGPSVPVEFIPYFARLNRGSNFFRVWIPVD